MTEKMRAISQLIVCLLCVPCLHAAELWKKQATLAQGEKSVDVPLTAERPVLLDIRVTSGPENWNWQATCVTAAAPGPHRQFRLPEGEHVVTIADRWGNAIASEAGIELTAYRDEDETEPANDAPHTPRGILLDEEIGVVIFPAGDVDHLRVDCPERGYLFVETTTAVEGFNLIAELTDETGTVLGTNQGRAKFAGPVTIAVKDRWGNFSSPEPVPLRVKFFPETDPGEPNDSLAVAVPTKIDQWHEALIAPAGDQDFFTITVENEGYLSIDAFGVPENITLVWTLWDLKTGQALGDQWPFIVKPGAYGISMRERWNSGWSLDLFRFRLISHDLEKITPAESESATLMRGGESRQIRLMHPGEQDRIAVEAEKLSIIRFTASGPDGAHLLFRDADKREANPHWLRARPGRTEVALRERWSKPVMSGIEVTVEVIPEIDPTEPNDRPEDATTITSGDAIPFCLYPAGDIDWFSVNSSIAPGFRIQVRSPTGRLDDLQRGIRVQSYDAEGNRAANWWFERRGDLLVSPPLTLPDGSRLLTLDASDHASEDGLTLRLIPVDIPDGMEFATGDTGEPVDAGVHVVGIELNEESKARLSEAIENAGGSFYSADSAGEIALSLGQISDRILSKPDGKFPNRGGGVHFAWFLLVPLLLVLGVKMLRRSKGSRRGLPRDGSW
jgi:hypothetical protein